MCYRMAMRDGQLFKVFCIVFVILLSMPISIAGSKTDPPLDLIELPPGFKIEVFTSDVPNARQMAWGTNGTLFVGSRRAGKVYAILDPDRDYHADQVLVIAKGLKLPVGVAFYKNDLYVSAVDRILRFKDIENHLTKPPRPTLVAHKFPKEAGHGWKFIRFGPDNKLYVPQGAPCNVCEKSNPVYATITRLNPDGTDFEIFAKGVRNSVGFDWHPETGELWFTDNGRDWLGDDLPPDELNHAPRSGLHFGFPYCHGISTSDPEFGSKHPCSDFVPARVELGAHVAALGMRFYTGDMFPKEFKNSIFIAQHGSWNRSVPSGYDVTCIKMAGSVPIKQETFARGWLQGKRAWGRPADVLIAPDGSLLVSDDRQGAIYRIYYTG